MMQNKQTRVPSVHIFIYLCAMSINGFDGTVVIPILPLIAETFSVNPADLSGIEWAFLIASAAILPLAGWLGSRLGTVHVFRLFLLGLGVGLLLSCLATQPWILILGRVIQGASSGILVPVGLTMMYRNTTGADRLRISRITLIPLTIAPMLGPVLGGLLAHQYGWRFIFGALAVFTFVVSCVAFFFMKPEKNESTQHLKKVDGVGLSILVIAVASLALIPSVLVETIVTPSPVLASKVVTWGLLGCGAVFLAFFSIKRARKQKNPALAVNSWGSKIFRHSTTATGLSFAALSGFLFFVPILLSARGADVQTIGFMMFPETLGLLIGGQLMIPLKKILGTRNLMILGYLGATGIAIFIVNLPEAGIVFSGGMFCFSLFLSQPILIAQSAAFTDIEPEDMDETMTLFMMLKTVLSAWGVVLMSATISWYQLPETSGIITAELLLTIIWLISLILIFRVSAVDWERGTAEE